MRCSICGSNQFTSLYQVQSGEITQCNECDIVTRSNLVAGDELLQFYNDWYVQHPFFDSLKLEADTNIEPYLVYNRVLKKLEQRVEKQRLLDVGCSYGAFLDVARKYGWGVQGVEICETSADYAVGKRGIDVVRTTLEQAGFPDGYFSAVTLWDLIEHLENPLQTMREVNKILAPNGTAFICTPNHDSLINKIGNIMYKLSFHRFKKPLNILHPIQHNYYFSPATLSNLLSRAGFSRIEIDFMDAKVDHWCPDAPSFLAWGSKCLDCLARVSGNRYRMLVYASK
ncbi:MAG: class I SAM-dependent methyltransferase [Cyanobacteria bacterium]|nr:class I SAM-dependent methyltransferase [Cyanobacteriota bacterium]